MIRGLFFLAVLISMVSASTIEIQVQNQSCPANADFLQVIYNLPSCIVQRFFSTTIDGLVYSAKQFLDNSLAFIINGPDVTLFCSPYSNVMKVIESLYTIALMGVGAYYLSTANDAVKRASAKIWMERIFLMILLLAFSFTIFKMILEVNNYITLSIYNQSFSNLFTIKQTFSSLIFAFIMSLWMNGLTFITFATVLMRYLMIPFLLLLFPFGILLYFLPFTSGIGSFILKFSLLVIFMTSVDAVLIAGLTNLFSVNDPTLGSSYVLGMALALGFGLIGIVNLGIYAVAILSALSEVLKPVMGLLSGVFTLAFLASFL